MPRDPSWLSKDSAGSEVIIKDEDMADTFIDCESMEPIMIDNNLPWKLIVLPLILLCLVVAAITGLFFYGKSHELESV